MTSREFIVKGPTRNSIGLDVRRRFEGDGPLSVETKASSMASSGPLWRRLVVLIAMVNVSLMVIVLLLSSLVVVAWQASYRRSHLVGVIFRILSLSPMRPTVGFCTSAARARSLIIYSYSTVPINAAKV
jgi:hypothetical protein